MSPSSVASGGLALRLAGLSPPMRGGGPARGAEATSFGEKLVRALGARATSAAAPSPRALDALVPPRPTPHGPLHLLEAEALPWGGVAGPTVEALGLASAALDPRRPLFLDTETTGLAGGSGTLAFLVGVARVEGAQVRVEQAHLVSPGTERPMLEWLKERLAHATLLVTFNGKSFDWPLLKTRFVMNRLLPPSPPPHLDLLHCARRVFRFELPQCTLSALERAALGHRRAGDIDGADIPSAWFDYLRTGRVAALGQVLAHNQRDVVSMVELLVLLAEAWEGRRALSSAATLGLATLAARRRDGARALAWLDRVEPAGALGGRALELKAALLRRRGDVGGAVAALEASLPVTGAPARVSLALAKLYEHQLKDYARAEARAVAGRGAEAPGLNARRLERLRAKASQPSLGGVG